MTRRLSRSVAAWALVLVAATGATGAAAAPAEPEPGWMVSSATPRPTATPEETPEPDPIRTAQYWLDEYGITKAWQKTKGKGVTIAVIDTGVGRGPVEFDGAVAGGADFSGLGSSDGRSPVGAVDPNHGSWVASLAAARGTGPDAGMIGVAPEAKILSLSVGFTASATVPFVDQVADAMRWAVDHGADVINLSFTTNTLSWDEKWDDAFLYAYEHDVVVVAAAGNRASGTEEVGAPATIPGVLTVGGVTRDEVASDGASTQGIIIGVSAPSEELLGVSADGTVVLWGGTSGAAPIVSGVVALVRAAHPELDAVNVINRIVKTARATSASREHPELYGYGLVDAEAAVSANVAAVTANPMGDLAEWVRLYRRGEIAPTAAPTATATPVPPLPPADQATKTTPLLPSDATLRYGTVPLAAGTLAAIMVGLGVNAAARRILSARAPRDPSR